MASTIPSQERVVDPFASYSSNVVNRLTEIVTHNEEGLLTVNGMQVISDSSASNTSVIVKPGYAVKDDVLIKITAEHTVDFTDDDQWVTPPDITFAGGNCYVVLQYQYARQRPAPQANIKILQPSERGLVSSSNSIYMLLKVVSLSATSPHNITALYDYDPEAGYDNMRPYIKYYAGGEVEMPTFSRVRDQGRFAYETARDKFFFGHSTEWRELTAGGVSVDITTDTTGVFVGQLCYVDTLGNASPAKSDSLFTAADMIVTSIGSGATGVGRGIVSGYGEDVPVETGQLVAVGDILYLSETEEGTVTPVRPQTYYQIVGRALTTGSSTTPVDMIFSPKIMLAVSKAGQITSWSGPDATGYYHDIDVAALDGTAAFDCHWFDNATKREVRPSEVEIRSGGDVIRVYFAVNTLTIDFIIQTSASAGGPLPGGGGGGVSDHSLLLNLDYAVSGHTGFAAGNGVDAGGNTHDNDSHIVNYVTATDVSFANLNVNGDVGAGAAQVAIGNHTHASGDTYNYNDVPSGSIILFESDTATVGYTLLTTQDDQLVYITKGSAAGGETGGTLYSGSTWTQPNHSHSVTSVGNHTHTTTAVALTEAQLAPHDHVLEIGQVSGPSTGTRSGWNIAGTFSKYSSYTTSIRDAGSGAAHSHGSTGGNGSHDHGGSTGNTQAGGSSWRPRGRNYTRQQKI